MIKSKRVRATDEAALTLSNALQKSYVNDIHAVWHILSEQWQWRYKSPLSLLLSHYPYHFPFVKVKDPMSSRRILGLLKRSALTLLSSADIYRFIAHSLKLGKQDQLFSTLEKNYV